MLIQWAEGKERGKHVPWPIRRYAMNMLIAYGFGRPREAIEITAPPDGRIDFSCITTAELRQALGIDGKTINSSATHTVSTNTPPEAFQKDTHS